MAWPQTFGINSPNFIGKTGSLPSVIAFGTNGVWTNVIVKSMRSTPMIEEIKVMQGGGLTATDILIYDGDEMEVTVDDDRSLVWPLSGGVVTIINPQSNLANGSNELFQVINNNYNIAQKAVGERTFLLKAYNLIAPVQM